MQWMSGWKCRGIVAAGQDRGADCFGESHAAIPVGLIARHAAGQDQGKLRFLRASNVRRIDVGETAGVGAGAKREASGI